MNFNFVKDLMYVKEVLDCSNEELCNLLNISRMTLYRWINGKVVLNNSDLENLYSLIYKNDIRINNLKEEIYKTKENRNLKILYHGSKSFIDGDITINRSDSNKDFGKGFYLGESLFQSASFVSNYPHPSVYVIEFNLNNNLRIKELNVSLEWMILISYFRGKLDEYKNSKYLIKLLNNIKCNDVIIAPIADNTMYDILDSFSSGDITDLQCLNALSANWLGKQYVFLNDEVIHSSLRIIDRLYICNKEKEEYITKKEEGIKVGKDKVKIAKRAYAGKGKYIEELLV